MASSVDEKESGCPVQHSGPGDTPTHVKADQSELSCGGCPYNEEGFNTANMMPPSSQDPHPDQPFPLSKERQTSGIPKGGETTEKWVYPSEQMFFNAMVKKGWKWQDWEMQAEDMKHIISIHNRNNEEAWQEVLKWEALHAKQCMNPRLVSFRGRAKDFSPRARVRAWLGYELPFDRHDWVVDRCGRRVRYVIDYYGCEPSADQSVPIYLDVRPALDSPGAMWDRAKVAFRRWTS